MLLGASQVTTCAAGETCKTDTVYQTGVDATPTQAVYCGAGTADATWFRQMPTPGLGELAFSLFVNRIRFSVRELFCLAQLSPSASFVDYLQPRLSLTL